MNAQKQFSDTNITPYEKFLKKIDDVSDVT